MAGLIRSASLTNFADVARSAGLDPLRLCTEFGLPPRALRDPDLRVPLDAVRDLLETSAERSGDEAFGLKMAEARELSNLGPLGLLVREQPTLRLAIKSLAYYARKLNQVLFLTLEETGDVAVLREELIVGHAGAVRQSTDLAIGVAFRMLRVLLGPSWKPLRVCFAHDAPNPNADPGMARYVRQLVESGIGRDVGDTGTQVRELVLGLLGTGQCTIDVVSRHLGVDRRTVHRRLADEGQTYSQIVDAVRRELADRYMKNRNRSLAEVSSLLGFSAPSGFTRWYTRQFGDRPSRRRATPSARR
jgi:AraC-like DNA-binding protein